MFRNRRIIHHEEIGGEAELLPSPPFRKWNKNKVGGRIRWRKLRKRRNWRVEKTPGLGGVGMTMVFLKRSETGKRWLNNEKSHEWNRVTNKKRCARVALCERTNFKSAHV